MSTKKHSIYVINTADSGKSYWNRAGVAFENKDGSFTFRLVQMLRRFRPSGEKGNRSQAPSGRSWRNLCASESGKELRIAADCMGTPHCS